MLVEPRDRWYFIHDNGGKPFRVCINNSEVNVYGISNQKELDDNWEFIGNGRILIKDKSLEPDYSRLIGTFNAKRVFVGQSTPCNSTRFSGGLGPRFAGNSILVHLDSPSDPLRYLFIGQCVYTFSAPEEIIYYYSPVGNNDVPYPVARSNRYAFFMLDQRYSKISSFKTVLSTDQNTEAWNDLYGEWYGHDFDYPVVNSEPSRRWSMSFPRVKVVAKRFG